MTRPSVPVRIVAVAAVLVLALVGLVAREGVARAQGREIRLAIEGYDPRSPLSGHYVAFQLRDRLPPTACSTTPSAAKVRLWMIVRPDGAGHRIVTATRSRPAAQAPGEVAVRGVATCYGTLRRTPDGRQERVEADVRPDVGVDRMHLPQDAAEALERALRGPSAPDARVVLSVGRDGQARLKGLIVGGRRIDADWLWRRRVSPSSR